MTIIEVARIIGIINKIQTTIIVSMGVGSHDIILNLCWVVLGVRRIDGKGL